MSKRGLSKGDLLKLLRKLKGSGDTEDAHWSADKALVKFINDPEITKAYEAIPKWYA